MDKIPQEIKDHIVDQLIYEDIKTMRLVHSSFKNHASALLFDTVHIYNRLTTNHNNIVSHPDLCQYIKNIELQVPIVLEEGLTPTFEGTLKANTLDNYCTQCIESQSLEDASAQDSMWDTCTALLSLAKGNLTCFEKITFKFSLPPDDKLVKAMSISDDLKAFFNRVTNLVVSYADYEEVGRELVITNGPRVKEIFATLSEFTNSVESLTLGSKNFEGVKEGLLNANTTGHFLFHPKTCPKLRELWCHEIWIEVEGLKHFLLAHSGTLEMIGFEDVTIAPTENHEAETLEAGWLEIIQLMAQNLQLKYCSFNGNLRERYPNGLTWYLYDYSELKWRRRKLGYRPFCGAELKDYDVDKSLSKAVHDHVLKKSGWPFPDRAWFTEAHHEDLKGNLPPRKWKFGDGRGNGSDPFGDYSRHGQLSRK